MLGAVLTAGVLGVTHAIEPDHVAGIASLTGRYGDARRSALVGACFSAGHVALVVAWLAITFLLHRRTEFGPLYDRIGTVGAGVLLGALGVAMALAGLRTALYRHEHGGEPHFHLRLPFLPNPDHSAHPGTARSYLRTGLLGALFTLSPPLSMIAFVSTVFPRYGGGAVGVAVATYAVGITATMSLIGAGVGGLFGASETLGPRTYGSAQFVAGVLVAGLAATMLVGSLG